MSDSKGEPTQKTHEPSPDSDLIERLPPDSGLTERLLARGTRALGVIDVRHTERHYARIMDWLAGRTPLLEHLRLRYGLTEDERARSLGLAFADAHGQTRAQGIDGMVNLSAASDSFTAPTVEQLFTSVANVSDVSHAVPTETMRITRRGVPTFSPVSFETRSGAGTHRERGDGGESTLEQGSPSLNQTRDLHAPSSVKEISDASAIGESQTSKPLSSSSSSPDGSASLTLGRATSTASERATSALKRADETLAHGEGLLASKGESVSSRAVGAKRASEAANPNVSKEIAPKDIARKDAAHQEVLRVAASSDANPLSLEAPLNARQQAGVRRGFKSAGVAPEEGNPTLERHDPADGAKDRALKTGAARAAVASEIEATSVALETRLPLAQAREIPAVAFEHETTNDRAQSPLTLAASPVNGEHAQATQPQHSSATGGPAVKQVSADGAETFTSARGRTGDRAAAPNVERLAEQVSRHLTRRLLVERERRGLGRK
jgi:hypothetical protein